MTPDWMEGVDRRLDRSSFVLALAAMAVAFFFHYLKVTEFRQLGIAVALRFGYTMPVTSGQNRSLCWNGVRWRLHPSVRNLS